MAIAALRHRDKHDLIISHEVIDFGEIQRGDVVQQKLIIRNNQGLMQRVNVRPPVNNPHISIVNFEGPIAPGLSKVSIQRAAEPEP